MPVACSLPGSRDCAGTLFRAKSYGLVGWVKRSGPTTSAAAPQTDEPCHRYRGRYRDRYRRFDTDTDTDADADTDADTDTDTDTDFEVPPRWSGSRTPATPDYCSVSCPGR
jgi:hypothetical protein